MRPTCIALVILLCASSTPALAREAPRAQKRAETLLERVLPSWQEFWRLLKNGSGIDPFGVPAPSSEDADPRSAPEGENGSGIDPWGGK